MDQRVSRVDNAASLQIGTRFARRSSSSIKYMYLNITLLKLLYHAHERGGVGMYKALVERRDFYQIQFHGG
jgi:hypothetical protein